MTPGIGNAEDSSPAAQRSRFCEAVSCVHAAVPRQSDLDLHHTFFFFLSKTVSSIYVL